jgi:hypothetical protein
MLPRLAALLVLALAGCQTPPPPVDQQAHVPPFARVPYEPFGRADAIAIALREWRLWGQPVDDDPPGSRPPPRPQDKPERMPGLWQRVGEYWWLGQNATEPDAAWTGKHDAHGQEFPADQDGDYAWSAAFISYVMRIAGAGTRFPYSPTHATYIDIARDMSLGRTSGWVVWAEPPDGYAPVAGDLICTGRGSADNLRFGDLPAPRFPGHCDIVVDTSGGQLSVIGGNVDDAVTMKHVPVTANGQLAEPGQPPLDTRYPWFVVLKILYDR